MKNKFLTVGISGAIISAVCCFTPLLIWVLPAIGLASVMAYLDFVLLPALLIFMVIAAIGFWRWRTVQ